MISRTRSFTVLGGIGLAAGLLTLLGLAGVGSQHEASPPEAVAEPVTGGDPRMATQPELRQVLLTADDLPAGFRPSPVPARPAVAATPVTECQTLFERLSALAAPATGAAVSHTGRTPGSSLRQAVTIYPAQLAAEAVGALRAATSRCSRFPASLDDGTAVTVEMAPYAQILPRDSFTVRLSVAGPRGTMSGYLAVGRVGQVVSVLRDLGPVGTVPAQEVTALLDRALDKLVPVGTQVVSR
ncbi:MAG TPA: hypothetical protein VFE14_17090 [Micromonosporaceae bacterium]|jgi:hypothetical protein|nr:hypothetical protein [Micromonosporaceae bacterium]